MMKLTGILRRGLFIAALVLTLATVTDAREFVSYNGRFYITFPNTWEQIDYRSVDYFLGQNNTNPALLRYEAVFAPVSERAFYDEPYLLLTFDSTGEFVGRARDSIVATIAAGFASRVDSVSRTELVTKIRVDAPLYIPEDQMFAVQTDIHEGRTITRRSLLVVRLTQTGLANFYFYAPDSVWTSALPTFVQIAQSLTPGTTPPGMTRESVKVADLSKETESSSATSIKRFWPIPGGFIVIIIAIIAARRRRRKQAAESKS